MEGSFLLFFASNILNNSFSVFTLEFDRWLQCERKPSYSLMKQYLKKKPFSISEVGKMLKFW